MRTARRSPRARAPKDYYKKRREARRESEIQLALRLAESGGGFVSRHAEDPEGSERWVRTGRWKEDGS